MKSRSAQASCLFCGLLTQHVQLPSHRIGLAALSNRSLLKLQLPKAVENSEARVLEMIQLDAANGFQYLIPEGACFVEILLSPSVLNTYRKAYETHPDVGSIPPMRIVKRGSLNHIQSVQQGGVIFLE